MSRFRMRAPNPTLAYLQEKHVQRKRGVFLHFNIQTFVDNDFPSSPPAASLFNPTALDIDQWLQAIVAMGGRYAILTAKHICGFCLWPTLTTGYNITASPWYNANGRVDIVDVFTRKCREYNVAPVLYLCVKDQSFELTSPTQAQYRSFSEAQLRELLCHYGDIALMWLDASNAVFFPSNGYPWADGATACNFIRGLQPSTIVVNNQLPIPDTNIRSYEGGNFPGQFVPGGNTEPAETCETIYAIGSPAPWFFKSFGESLRDADTLGVNIALANSRHSAYTINFPPDTTGTIPSDMVTVMQAIGAIP